MFDRIILGYDGSEQSRDALALARFFAQGAGHQVVVAHVVPRPQPYDARTREYTSLLQRHGHTVLDPVMEELAGLRADVRPIESASPARGLHELAEEEGASLIVIGSTHRGPLGRVLIGSVGEVLLAGTPAAIAVAPRGFAARTATAIETISTGFNRTAEGHAALRSAAALAAQLGVRLRAIAVEEGFARARRFPGQGNGRSGSLREELDRALADVQALDAERVILKGGAAERLAEACTGSDLLVIGSRSYGPIHHTLLGSVSARLMRSCRAPLYVVPRTAAGEAAKPPGVPGARAAP